MILKFIIAELPPGINQIKRMHWKVYADERDRWRLLIREAIGRNMHSFPGRVSVEYIAYRVQLMDKDNNNGSFKLVGDALVNLDIIKDDNPRIIDEEKSRYTQSRILHYPDQRIEVTIIDLEELARDKAEGVLHCDWCGGEIDQSKPYRLSRRGCHARHTKCYSIVNKELRGEGLGIMAMTLIEPVQKRIMESCNEPNR